MDGVCAPDRDWRLANPGGMADGSLHASTGGALLWCPEGRDWIGGPQSRWGHCSLPSQALVRLTRTHGTNGRRAGGVHAGCTIVAFCASGRARDMDKAMEGWAAALGSFFFLPFPSCMTDQQAAQRPTTTTRPGSPPPPSPPQLRGVPVQSVFTNPFERRTVGRPWMRSSTANSANVANATQHRTTAFTTHHNS